MFASYPRTIENHLGWSEKTGLLDEGYNSGYSCLTSIDEDTIGIIYECSQSDLAFESIPLDELLQK